MAFRLNLPPRMLLHLVLPVVIGLAWSFPVHGRIAEPAGKIRVLADQDYYPSLLAKVREAKERIDLAMFLWRITDSEGNRPRQLVLALGQAQRRGVVVRVVLEKSGYDQEINRSNRETAQLLRQEGIMVLFDSPAITTHAKVAVIDGRFVFLGSHNLTHSALARNHEVSLLLEDSGLAEELTTYLDRLPAQ